MIDVETTKEMRDEARRLAADLGILKASILQGEGNFKGMLGKLIVARFLSLKLEFTYEYDMILGTPETRIAVRTKATGVRPQPDHDCSVTAYNATRNSDWYVFVRVLKPDFRKGWILGYLTPKEYMTKAVFHRKGEIDPSNDFPFKADCYNVPISELHPLKLPDNRPQPGGWW